MAEKTLTSELKPGMVVTSKKTTKFVYPFGSILNYSEAKPMAGRAVVLREMTRITLPTSYGGSVTCNMLLLSHYKHGITMYFCQRSDDFTWYMVQEKPRKAKNE